MHRCSGRAGASAQPHALVIQREVFDAAVWARVEDSYFSSATFSTSRSTCCHPRGDDPLNCSPRLTSFLSFPHDN